jgi:hypothetical protein
LSSWTLIYPSGIGLGVGCGSTGGTGTIYTVPAGSIYEEEADLGVLLDPGVYEFTGDFGGGSAAPPTAYFAAK